MAKKVYQQKEIKKSMGIHARRTIAHIVLCIVAFLCLFWFYMLFVNCTRTHSEIGTGFAWLPGSNFVNNWKNMMNSTQPMVSGMTNSIIIAACSALLCVYFSTMTAFAIHAYDFKFKGLISTFILMIMMIPTQVTALGFIKFCREVGLENSFIPLILPSIASPVTYFYLKQYMDSSLSLSLIEAARIDGSSEFRTFNKVVLPLMKPAIAVQAIFSFVASWNNYFAPGQLLRDPDVKTLPILIAELRGADWLKFDMGQVYMAIAFSIFPVIVVYLILSKNIVGGVALGGVKE